MKGLVIFAVHDCLYLVHFCFSPKLFSFVSIYYFSKQIFMQIPGSQKEVLVSPENSALHRLFLNSVYELRTFSRKIDNKL